MSGKVNVATVGFGHAAGAYADENGAPVSIAPSPVLANHVFSIVGDVLEHYIDGRLRASVPTDGMREYADLWPDAKALVKSMLAPASKPAPKRSAKRRTA